MFRNWLDSSNNWEYRPAADDSVRCSAAFEHLLLVECRHMVACEADVADAATRGCDRSSIS